MPDIEDPRERAVIRLTLTATAAQHREVLPDFQDFVRTVRPPPATLHVLLEAPGVVEGTYVERRLDPLIRHTWPPA
ncbi:hypothetical protein ACFV85_04385 [Streptomyces niveus]|uniref:hypothetical protein n=1 Tax=Streptomyces niveus TaxID=193462 RepID=UPI003647666F